VVAAADGEEVAERSLAGRRPALCRVGVGVGRGTCGVGRGTCWVGLETCGVDRGLRIAVPLGAVRRGAVRCIVAGGIRCGEVGVVWVVGVVGLVVSVAGAATDLLCRGLRLRDVADRLQVVGDLRL
jgi:hypothetical protein